VYPAEVENVLYQHPAVQEAAVYRAPDEVTGEAVWATVVLKANQRATEEELIAFCGERIASFKVPRAIRLGEAIPKNPTGKVLKRLLVSAAQRVLATQPL
jgi:long-chain acyl-CoA synthetase